ncbi:MAG: HAD hydrolase-like protein [Bacteroidota bacterium]
MKEKVNEKNIKAVVFDIAGTTINEGDIVYQSVRNALQLFGFDFPLQKVIMEVGGMSKKEGITKLIMENYPDRHSKKLLDKIFHCFIEGLEERYLGDPSITEMEGATDLFQWLKSKDIMVALNTGYSRSTADILMERMQWKKHMLIDTIITSDEVEKGRPEPNMINEIANEFQLLPASMAKVGDTLVDIQEGHNAGCSVIVGITSSKYDKEALLNIGATHAIDQLAELKELI